MASIRRFAEPWRQLVVRRALRLFVTEIARPRSDPKARSREEPPMSSDANNDASNDANNDANNDAYDDHL